MRKMNTVEKNRTMWSNTFNKMLEEDLEYNDSWAFRFNNSITQDISEDDRRRGWKVYQTATHGHFRCSACSRTWSSARVTVLFHYRLQRDRGMVLMRPFRQSCQRCKGDFKLPGFSMENIEMVLPNLIGKIKKNCYGEEEKADESCVDKKVGTKPHESSLCEACSQGSCSEGNYSPQTLQEQ